MGLKLHNCSGLHERDVPGVNACPGGSAAGGDQNGLNLRSASWTNNVANQLTGRGVPGYVEVVGLATPTATVTVNTLSTYRRGEYFRKEITAANSSAPVYGANTVSAQWGTTNDTASGSQFVPQTPESFLYDPDGNLLRDGRWDYAWDAENRLIKLTTRTDVTVAPVRRLEFEYDGQGRRLRKTVYPYATNDFATLPTADTVFVYDGWNLVAELNATNQAVIRSYMWGTDLSGTAQGAGGVGGLLAVRQAGASHLATYDGNGNVLGLYNPAVTNRTARYEYGPFGEPIRATGPLAQANPFRFSTKYADDETGLLYYGYRYYSPTTGRWLSRDPLAEQGGLNLYGFVGNNPVSFLDRLGLEYHPIPVGNGEDMAPLYYGDTWWEDFTVIPYNYGAVLVDAAIGMNGPFDWIEYQLQEPGLFNALLPIAWERSALRSLSRLGRESCTVRGLTKSVATSTDDVAMLKSIRRHAERLIRGKVTSSNPATMLEVRGVQAAIANGDYRGAGTGFHNLNFQFARDAQARGFLIDLNIDRLIPTPHGFLASRRPDYLFNGGGIYDIKPFRPNLNAYDTTRQFLDIQGATGIMPVALYYRLW